MDLLWILGPGKHWDLQQKRRNREEIEGKKRLIAQEAQDWHVSKTLPKSRYFTVFLISIGE